MPTVKKWKDHASLACEKALAAFHLSVDFLEISIGFLSYRQSDLPPPAGYLRLGVIASGEGVYIDVLLIGKAKNVALCVPSTPA